MYRGAWWAAVQSHKQWDMTPRFNNKVWQGLCNNPLSLARFQQGAVCTGRLRDSSSPARSPAESLASAEGGFGGEEHSLTALPGLLLHSGHDCMGGAEQAGAHCAAPPHSLVLGAPSEASGVARTSTHPTLERLWAQGAAQGSPIYSAPLNPCSLLGKP